ncbi:nitrite reductase small subunit NirD [Shewanella sp. Isolate11]|uniref:nitrite reductase small subunit NirD n=1 Tax=Shewanella sp. Isolate11 TaxID=2908530 RepID=UPI001EFDD534|nr:nitrite reductase small subunit NirD [Shewanella sp. Isolate11]MCG9698162.1 nitrite reductase small subunit NirD [Shewanella sp. Isolate11]
MNTWVDICQSEDIVAGTGVCALLGSEQVAIFRCRQSDRLFAVSNYDPIGRANVLSRGIMGCIKGELVVSSPLYKQHFNLQTGGCLQDPNYQLKTYEVRRQGQSIQLLKVA